MKDRPPASIRLTLSRQVRRLAVLSVLLASGLLLFTGNSVMRGYLERDTRLIARTVAYAVEPALVFGDNAAADGAMRSLAEITGVRAIAVYDARGQAVARWHATENATDRRLGDLGERLFSNLQVRTAVMHRGRPVGSIVVAAGAAQLIRYLLAGAMVSICGVGIVLLTARIVARRIEDDVLAPLDQVIGMTHAVRESRDFRQRLPTFGVTEIDRLTHDFNALLAELAVWQDSQAAEKDALEFQATHDPLTGLGNRALFERSLDTAIADSAVANAPFALIYIDVDGFKAVNDDHGHAAGDALLVGVASRLSGCVRNADDVYRIGGDEFTLILGTLGAGESAAKIRDRIEAAMATPVDLPDGRALAASISIGVAVFPVDGTAIDTLMEHADADMYSHKQARRGHSRKTRSDA